VGQGWSQSLVSELSLERPALSLGEGDPGGVLGVLKERLDRFTPQMKLCKLQ